MIAILFEVTPKPGCRDAYLAIAATLKPLLEQIDGFISVERFQSLTRPDTLLSLSVFRDETALAAWRRIAEHREAQALGRNTLFADYRLRVASVVRDYGMTARDQAPDDSRVAHGG